MEPSPEHAEFARRLMDWVAPRQIRGRAPQARVIAARAMALGYVSGTLGPMPARVLARRLGISREKFTRYTVAGRRKFGLRNPWFSAHAPRLLPANGSARPGKGAGAGTTAKPPSRGGPDVRES